MNLYSILHGVFGEYTFKTGIKDFSRFATLAISKRLNIRMEKTDGEYVYFRVSLFSAEAVIALAGETGTEIELYKRRGLPFLFSRYRRRYGLLAGFFLFLLLLLASQLFVWKIEISGNERLGDKEIEAALDGIGIRVGAYIPDIDRLYKANELLLECRELSSAAITVNGTHITVSVLERVPTPEIVSQQGFYNVVSDYDGIVLDIDAADGTPEVHEGDTVFKGELLINSFIEGRNGSFTPTHARGIVYAAVEEKIEIEIPLKRSTRVYTGNRVVRRVYSVLGAELYSLHGLECDYEYFDAVASEKNVKLFGFIELPIKVSRVTYSEYTPLYEDIDEEEASLFAMDAFDDALSELDCEILECTHEISFDKEKGVCLLKANALVKRNIAREVPYELINYKISERFLSESE